MLLLVVSDSSGLFAAEPLKPCSKLGILLRTRDAEQAHITRIVRIEADDRGKVFGAEFQASKRADKQCGPSRYGAYRLTAKGPVQWRNQSFPPAPRSTGFATLRQWLLLPP